MMKIAVKIHKKVSGIPRARVTSAYGEDERGAGQVTVFIHALDAMDFPTVVASLRLSPDQAIAIGRKLIEEAGKAP